MDELERWLASINLSHLASKLKDHNVTAEVLSLCEAFQELEQYGMATGHARLLMRRIEEVRGVGVQLSAIAPPQIPPPAPLRPPAPTPPPGNEVGLIPSTSNLISSPIVMMYLVCAVQLFLASPDHQINILLDTLRKARRSRWQRPFSITRISSTSRIA